MSLAHTIPHCARCEALEAEVAWLKSELSPDVRAEQLDALRKLGLSPNAAHLLFALMARPGRAMKRALLSDALLPPLDHVKERDGFAVVDVYICRLRKCFGFDIIDTVWGVGYRLTEAGAVIVRAKLGDLSP